ncbi:formyl transferase [Rhizobium sp. SSA_523]|uniref:formyl transferase n=2 Tax=Rhizobium sp. SSA_523 TaxID=2952477 RepID=UPI0020910AB8|nr:formyl transferase [Rhizobium sp. SSA_523]MCO5730201.1 formyl transferase [Rhizobium sp. SSA_523]WKC25262.1 formyl transferase [Rhizobium sp. SSA_523]
MTMQDTRQARLLVLTAGGPNPQVMINALAAHFPNLAVIEEDYEPKSAILRRRARRLGLAVALGQLATMVVSRLGKRLAIRRSREILAQYGVSAERDPLLPVTRVASVNEAAAHQAIARYAPDLILTISCRLLTRQTLDMIACPVVNFHAGINPAYRGQMGAYWALVDEEPEQFGATFHLVDAGTDTGATLAEIRLAPSRDDTIATYPLLLTAAASQMAPDLLRDVLNGTAQASVPEGRSVLRFPPPVWTYLYHGLARRIW